MMDVPAVPAPSSRPSTETGGTVTRWLHQARSGNPDAVAELWQHYAKRLTALARVRLNDRIRRVFDENDLASVAFSGFMEAAAAGQYERVRNRDDLWRLLAAITANKARDRADYDRSLKRGGGNVRGESAFPATTPPGLHPPPSGAAKPAPDPAVLSALLDQAGHFLSTLGDEKLRAIALLKLQGFENHEIAERTEMATRSVERKISLVRRLWREEAEKDAR